MKINKCYEKNQSYWIFKIDSKKYIVDDFFFYLNWYLLGENLAFIYLVFLIVGNNFFEYKNTF